MPPAGDHGLPQPQPLHLGPGHRQVPGQEGAGGDNELPRLLPAGPDGGAVGGEPEQVEQDGELPGLASRALLPPGGRGLSHPGRQKTPGRRPGRVDPPGWG